MYKVDTFKRRIRSVLPKKNIKSVAKTAGCTEAEIKAYLSGEKTPDDYMLKTLAKAVGTNEWWLNGYNISKLPKEFLSAEILELIDAPKDEEASKTINPKGFGSRLKKLREDNGCTQAELADAIGLKQSIVSRYEAGSTVPSDEIINKIADFFSVSSYYVCGDTTAPELENEHIRKPNKAKMKIRKNFSPSRLREAVTSDGVEVKELCKKLRITTDILDRYLNGKTTPSVNTVENIAKALRINEDWLWGMEVSMEAERTVWDDWREVSSEAESNLNSQALRELLNIVKTFIHKAKIK